MPELELKSRQSPNSKEIGLFCIKSIRFLGLDLNPNSLLFLGGKNPPFSLTILDVSMPLILISIMLVNILIWGEIESLAKS